MTLFRRYRNIFVVVVAVPFTLLMTSQGMFSIMKKRKGDILSYSFLGKGEAVPCNTLEELPLREQQIREQRTREQRIGNRTNNFLRKKDKHVSKKVDICLSL